MITIITPCKIEEKYGDMNTHFWSRINYSAPNGCWEWLGCKQSEGYGQVYMGGKMFYAHRVAYEQVIGPIPEGLVIDHLCRHPICVNPYHLEPVTNRENTRRGLALEWKRRKTHCPRGHELIEGNLMPSQLKRGHRSCLACDRKRGRERLYSRRHEVGRLT